MIEAFRFYSWQRASARGLWPVAQGRGVASGLLGTVLRAILQTKDADGLHQLVRLGLQAGRSGGHAQPA